MVSHWAVALPIASAFLLASLVIIQRFPCHWLMQDRTGILEDGGECPSTLIMTRADNNDRPQVDRFVKFTAPKSNTSAEHIYSDRSASYLFYCQDQHEWHVYTSTARYIWPVGGDQTDCPPAGKHRWHAFPLLQQANLADNLCVSPSQKEWNAGTWTTITLSKEYPKDTSINHYQFLALLCLIAQSTQWILQVAKQTWKGSGTPGKDSTGKVQRAVAVLNWIQGHVVTKVSHNVFYLLYILGVFIVSKCAGKGSGSACASQSATLLWAVTVPLKICVAAVPILWLTFWFRVKSCGCQLFDPEKSSRPAPPGNTLKEPLLAVEAAVDDTEKALLLQIKAKQDELQEAMAMKVVNDRLQRIYIFGMALCRVCLFMNLLAGCSVLFAFSKVTVIQDAFSAFCSPISPLVLAEMILSMVWLAVPLCFNFIESFWPTIYAIFSPVIHALELLLSRVCASLQSFLRRKYKLIRSVCSDCRTNMLSGLRCCQERCSEACVGCLAGDCKPLQMLIILICAGCYQCTLSSLYKAISTFRHCIGICRCGNGGFSCVDVKSHCSKSIHGLKKKCSCLSGVIPIIWGLILAIPGAIAAVVGSIVSAVAAVLSSVVVVVGSICSPTLRGYLCACLGTTASCLKATPGALAALARCLFNCTKGAVKYLWGLVCSCLRACWQKLWSLFSRMKPRIWIQVEPVSKTYGCGFSHTRDAILEGIENGSIGLGPYDDMKAELEALKTMLSEYRVHHTPQALPEEDVLGHTPQALPEEQVTGSTIRALPEEQVIGHTSQSLPEEQVMGHISQDLPEEQVMGHTPQALPEEQVTGSTIRALPEEQVMGHTPQASPEGQGMRHTGGFRAFFHGLCTRRQRRTVGKNKRRDFHP